MAENMVTGLTDSQKMTTGTKGLECYCDRCREIRKAEKKKKIHEAKYTSFEDSK